MIDRSDIALTLPARFARGAARGGTAEGRLLVLGFDGMSWPVLRALAGRGLIPNLRRLMEDGAHAEIDCPPPTNSIVGWTSFMTGTNPGKHGIFNYGTLVRDAAGRPRDFVMSDATLRNIDPWWVLASEAGRRVIVLNVVGTYPPDLPDGIQLGGGPLVPLDYASYTTPPELTRELDGYGYSAPFSLNRKMTPDGRIRRVDEVALVAQHLAREADWDCLVVVFPEPDKTHSLGGEGPELERMYRRLDEVVGRLAATLGDGGRLVVLSDHGNGPYDRSVHLERWLYQHGWLSLVSRVADLPSVPRSAWLDDGLRGHATYGLFQILERVQMVGGRIERWPAVGGRLKAWLEAREREVDFDPVDWARTRVFRTRVDGSSSNCGGIRLLPGRVGADDLAALVRGLRAITDPVTGQPVVEDVVPRDRLYSGPLVSRIPDLIVTLREGYGMARYAANVDSIRDPRVITVHDRVRYTHQRSGVLMMAGEGIRPGRVDGARIFDVAPNLLYVLGVPVPAYMDGVVLDALYEVKHLDAHPVTRVERDGNRFGGGEANLARARRMDKISQRNLMRMIYKDGHR